jgi:hypothetical protein
MKQKTQFQSENILMSVFGHLFLLAVLMMSFSVVVERAKLVTPNRIEIIEIDLKNVRVSGEETKLYNTNVPQQKPDEKIDKKAEDKEIIQDEKTELKQPTMVESESKKTTTKDTPKNDEKKAEDKPAPRSKRLVRVNREVLSIDRTMTVSVIDALRVALARCWVIDTNRPGLEDIRLTAHIKFLPTGVVDKLWFESESRAQTDPDFAYVLETARAAIDTCSPFSMLPRNEYNAWRDTSVTFYPTSGKVM